MKTWEFFLFIGFVFALALTNIGQNNLIVKNKDQIKQLTERVFLLENALSDQIGVKK